jgi:hypothetical protein
MNCLHGNLVRAQERRECDHQDELLEIYKKSITRLNRDIDILEEVIEKAKRKGHYNTLTKLMQAVRQSVELSFKLLMSISTTQNVERDFNTILGDERLNEILDSCATADLIGFKRVLAKLVDRTSIPMIEIQSGGDLEGALAEDDVEGKDEDNYQSLMVRTTTPPRAGEDIDQDKEPQLDSRDQLNAEEAGEQDQDEITPPPP